MSIKFALWLGVFVFYVGPNSAAASTRGAEINFLEKTNAELDSMDDLLERELIRAERTLDDERSKDLQGMQLWVKDLRGELLKLAPAGEQVWQDSLPQLRQQLRQLRQEVAEVRTDDSRRKYAE